MFRPMRLRFTEKFKCEPLKRYQVISFCPSYELIQSDIPASMITRSENLSTVQLMTTVAHESSE